MESDRESVSFSDAVTLDDRFLFADEASQSKSRADLISAKFEDEDGESSTRTITGRAKEHFFAVMYALTTNNRLFHKLAVYLVIIDFLQLLGFTLMHSIFPWNNSVKGLSTVIGQFQFYWESAWPVFFWILTTLVVVTIFIAAWVGYKHSDNTSSVTPVKILRVLLALFITVLYVPTVKVLIRSLLCTRLESSVSSLSYLCLSRTHLFYLIFGGCVIMVYFPMVAFAALTYFDPHPKSHSLVGKQHSRMDFVFLLSKTLLTVISMYLKSELASHTNDYNRLASIVVLIIVTMMLVSHLLILPYYSRTMNMVRAALLASITWSAICLVVTVIVNNRSVAWPAYLLFAGIVPFSLVFSLYARSRLDKIMSVARHLERDFAERERETNRKRDSLTERDRKRDSLTERERNGKGSAGMNREREKERERERETSLPEYVNGDKPSLLTRMNNVRKSPKILSVTGPSYSVLTANDVSPHPQRERERLDEERDIEEREDRDRRERETVDAAAAAPSPSRGRNGLGVERERYDERRLSENPDSIDISHEESKAEPHAPLSLQGEREKETAKEISSLWVWEYEIASRILVLSYREREKERKKQGERDREEDTSQESDEATRVSLMAVSHLFSLGIKRYPKSGFLIAGYITFLTEWYKKSEEALSYCSSMLSMNPALDSQFLAYRCKQDAIRSESVTGVAEMDLVTYLEFQRDYEQAKRKSSKAKRKLAVFWRDLYYQKMTEESIPVAIASISSSIEGAQSLYINLLRKFPRSARILRSYGVFCEEVISDNDKALGCFLKANLVEHIQKSQQQVQGSVMGRAPGDKFSLNIDNETRAMVIATSKMEIVAVTDSACRLFGYKRDELIQKNVSILMPSPYSEQHDTFVNSYLETGVSHILGCPREMEGVDSKGNVFPVEITITEVNSGAQRYFVGLFIPVSDGAARITIDGKGKIIALNEKVATMFGFAGINDLKNKKINMLMHPNLARNHDSYLERFIRENAEASMTRESFVNKGSRTVVGKHRDGTEIPLSLEVSTMVGAASFSGRPESVIFHGVFTPLKDLSAVVSIDSNGVILSCNQDIALLFGRRKQDLLGKNVSILMPSPYAEFHNSYLSDYLATGTPKIVNKGWRKVEGLHADGTVFRLKLSVVEVITNGVISFAARLKPITVKGTSMANFKVDLNGTIISFDSVSLSMFELEPEETLGRQFSSLFSTNLGKKEHSFLSYYQSGGKEIKSCSFRVLTEKTKQEIVVAIKGSPVIHLGSPVIHFTSYRIDNMDATITINTKGIILSCNDFIEHLLGYESNFLIGKNVNIIVPEPFRSMHDGYLERYLATGEKHVLGQRRSLNAVHKNGDIVPVFLEAVQGKSSTGETLFMARLWKSSDDQRATMGFSSDAASEAGMTERSSNNNSGSEDQDELDAYEQRIAELKRKQRSGSRNREGRGKKRLTSSEKLRVVTAFSCVALVFIFLIQFLVSRSAASRAKSAAYPIEDTGLRSGFAHLLAAQALERLSVPSFAANETLFAAGSTFESAAETSRDYLLRTAESVSALSVGVRFGVPVGDMIPGSANDTVAGAVREADSWTSKHEPGIKVVSYTGPGQPGKPETIALYEGLLRAVRSAEALASGNLTTGFAADADSRYFVLENLVFANGSSSLVSGLESAIAATEGHLHAMIHSRRSRDIACLCIVVLISFAIVVLGFVRCVMASNAARSKALRVFFIIPQEQVRKLMMRSRAAVTARDDEDGDGDGSPGGRRSPGLVKQLTHTDSIGSATRGGSVIGKRSSFQARPAAFDDGNMALSSSLQSRSTEVAGGAGGGGGGFVFGGVGGGGTGGGLRGEGRSGIVTPGSASSGVSGPGPLTTRMVKFGSADSNGNASNSSGLGDVSDRANNSDDDDGDGSGSMRATDSGPVFKSLTAEELVGRQRSHRAVPHSVDHDRPGASPTVPSSSSSSSIPSLKKLKNAQHPGARKHLSRQDVSKVARFALGFSLVCAASASVLALGLSWETRLYHSTSIASLSSLRFSSALRFRSLVTSLQVPDLSLPASVFPLIDQERDRLVDLHRNVSHSLVSEKEHFCACFRESVLENVTIWNRKEKILINKNSSIDNIMDAFSELALQLGSNNAEVFCELRSVYSYLIPSLRESLSDSRNKIQNDFDALTLNDLEVFAACVVSVVLMYFLMAKPVLSKLIRDDRSLHKMLLIIPDDLKVLPEISKVLRKLHNENSNDDDFDDVI